MNYTIVPGINGGCNVLNDEQYAIQLRHRICQKYNLQLEEFLSRYRGKLHAEARQIFYYLLSKKTKLTLKRMGQLTGGRDHATALFGINKIKGFMEYDKDFRAFVNELDDNIPKIQSLSEEGLTIKSLKRYTRLAQKHLIAEL